MFSNNDCINFLEQCYDEEIAISEVLTRTMIRQLSHDHDPQVRAWLAKALVFDCDVEKNIRILSCLAKDTDAFVRLEAVDSLGSYIYEKCWHILTMSIQDEDSYVRAYAALSLGTVGKEIFPAETATILKNRKLQEKDDYVIVAVLESLYAMGQLDSLDQLLQYFNNRDYLVRCSVLRALANLLDKNNISEIKKFIMTIDPVILSEAEKDAFCSLRIAIEAST